jgi:hypothetical protein
MKKSKFISAAITLLLIAFFTTSWVSSTEGNKPTAISIVGTFSWTEGTTFDGPVILSGAIEASGTANMVADINAHGNVYHCVWTLAFAEGTITLHEQCEIAGSTWQGRWEIVSGTGVYSNLRGNGSSLMPDKGDGFYWEVLKGVIY